MRPELTAAELAIQPKMIKLGLSLLGTAEVPGVKNNPVIMDWSKTLGLDSIYLNDDTAWCGLFMAWLCNETGKAFVAKPLWARSWVKFGVKADQPKRGDVLVFERGQGGHVGLYWAEDSSAYYVLGGNQGNCVSITRVSKNRLLAARRPLYSQQPPTVKAYTVTGTGQALSVNEA